MESHLEATLEEVEARHRKEKKVLIAKTTALKRTIPKGDKNKKKEVTAEITNLEKQHEGRQRAELIQFAKVSQTSTAGASEKESVSTIKQTSEEENDDESPAAPTMSLYGSAGQTGRPAGKKNKAKQRQQRKAEEMRRMQEEAELEAEDMVDVAAVETEAIEKLVAGHSLSIQQIRPDGHCLYSAFADQVSTYHDQPASYSQMRQRAAEYMRGHCDDFIPFMTHDNGDMFTAEDFERHCDDVENTATWGGQQEITALAHALQLPVHIFQSGLPILQIGEETFISKMSVGRVEVLRLYRSSLRAAQQFETYNFRKYFYRRTRDQFRAASGLTDTQAIAASLAEARGELKVMQRQGVLNKMFAHNRTVIESDPQYASGARRYAE
ncbi:OTU protein [Coemansia sp. RSA 1972]|nr:OTU protein [Coemansia sp. RSA 1972]